MVSSRAAVGSSTAAAASGSLSGSSTVTAASRAAPRSSTESAPPGALRVRPLWTAIMGGGDAGGTGTSLCRGLTLPPSSLHAAGFAIGSPKDLAPPGVDPLPGSRPGSAPAPERSSAKQAADAPERTSP
eukprot:357397-Chlamydomonas_euryale.AAC.8